MKEVAVSAKACSNLAGAYLSQGTYALAVQYYLEAMQYLEKTNDQLKIAANYHCLGIAYYMLKNYPLSLKYYYKSIEVGQNIGHPDETGYNYNGIGVAYKEIKRYDSALLYLEKAHVAAEKNNDQYLLSHNLSNKGEVYSATNHLDEALKCLSAAFILQLKNNDQRGVSETSVLLGDAFLNTGDYVQSRKYYDSARIIATSIDAKDVLKNAWKGLSTVYSRLNDPGAALLAYQRYSDLKDTLYTEESSRQVAEMQTKYNTEKQEKENTLLQKENTIKNLQLARERNQKYTIIASVAFLILISFVYYNRYRLKQKNEILKERELRAYAVFQAQENEKTRLSGELHDGLGALLALIKLNLSSIAANHTNEKILISTKQLATDAITEVRNIAHELMPSVLAKSGLHAALMEMVNSVKASGALDIELTYSLSERLPPAIESNLFRIVQEATNNIVKHSGATNEILNIAQDGDYVVVTIKDNGKGFDKNILSKISGNGLNNIVSRVNTMKGKTDIIAGKNNGTQIEIVVPLKNSYNG